MTAQLTLTKATAHTADLERHASETRRRSTRRSHRPAVELRLARSTDTRALVDLAALDSAAPLEGAVLVASQDGDLVAALELETGRAVASPMVRTAETVALLRVRAEQLDGRRHARSWRRAFGLRAA